MPRDRFDSDSEGLRQPTDACWVVCESSRRWSRAVRRFAAQLAAPHPALPVVSAGLAQVPSLLSVRGTKIVLWEVSSDQLVPVCDRLIQAASIAPQCLQLVAWQGLSERQRLTLAELPIAAFVRHPEDLPALQPIVQGYFARHPQLLD